MRIDNVIVVGNRIFEDHLTSIEDFLKHLFKIGLQAKTKKCKQAAHELAFLEFSLSQEGFKPDLAKVEALLSIALP